MSVHTITVTQVPNTDLDLPDDQYVDEVKFTVDDCPKTTCIVWWECKECHAYDPTDEEADDGEYTRHGVFHQNIDGDWMTESNDCALDVVDSASDAMQDAAWGAGLGTHQFDVQYAGDGFWDVSLIKPPEAQHPALADPEGLALVKAIHDRKNERTTMNNNRESERGDMDGLTMIAALALFAVIALGYGIYAYVWNNTTETKVCTVQEKQATSHKEGGTNYILFTKECGQLQVADSWFQGNFNSTDLYGSLHEGTSYTMKTVGWRNGFFSTYPNVIEATQ